MSEDQPWTIGRLLTWTTDYLKKHNAQSPRLDAEVLLAHARSCQRIELYTAFGEEPADEVKATFREMVRRRAEGMPVAYLVGHKEFYAMNFEVCSDVLIPRPETEHLVIEALDWAKLILAEDANRQLRIVDVGTGSGAIAVALAKHLPNARIVAVDISEAALQIAKRNAELHSIAPESLRFLHSDLLNEIPTDEKFDLVVSNPPYVSEAEYAELSPSVRDFEPRLALVAEENGAAAISKLASQASERLDDGGGFIFEFSPMLAPRVHDMIGKGWEEPKITKDLAGLERVVTLRKAVGS